MKTITGKSLMCLVILLFIVNGLKAQTVKVDTSTVSADNNAWPCFIVNVDPDSKAIQKEWVKYLKANYQVKLKSSNLFPNQETLAAEGITFSVISTKRLNFYSQISGNDSGSTMKVFSSLGYDIFIGPLNYPGEFDAMKNIIQRFLVEYLNKYYINEIKVTSKLINSLNKEKVSALKSIDKNNKQISEITDKINVLRATQTPDETESIKNIEKSNKLSDKKRNLENENIQTNIEVTTLENEVESAKARLERLKFKQANL